MEEDMDVLANEICTWVRVTDEQKAFELWLKKTLDLLFQRRAYFPPFNEMFDRREFWHSFDRMIDLYFLDQKIAGAPAVYFFARAIKQRMNDINWRKQSDEAGKLFDMWLMLDAHAAYMWAAEAIKTNTGPALACDHIRTPYPMVFADARANGGPPEFNAAVLRWAQRHPKKSPFQARMMKLVFDHLVKEGRPADIVDWIEDLLQGKSSSIGALDSYIKALKRLHADNNKEHIDKRAEVLRQCCGPGVDCYIRILPSDRKKRWRRSPLLNEAFGELLNR